MKSLIISGFPGTGKTYFKNKYSDIMTILDSDSSQFPKDETWPQNYINDIKENLETKDIIFVSTHDIVRDALVNNNIKFIVIHPNINCKENWIKSLKERALKDSYHKESLKWITFIDENWEDIINSLIEHCNQNYIERIVLEDNERISDIFDTINKKLNGLQL